MDVLIWILITSLVEAAIAEAEPIDISNSRPDSITDQFYKVLISRIDHLEQKLELRNHQHKAEIIQLRHHYQAKIDQLRHDHKTEIVKLRHDYENDVNLLRQDGQKQRERIQQLESAVQAQKDKIDMLQKLQDVIQTGERRSSEDTAGHVPMEQGMTNHSNPAPEDTAGHVPMEQEMTNHSNPAPEMSTRSAVVSRNRIRRAENEVEVAFFATLTRSVDHIGFNQAIPFDNVVTNIGNSYNPHFGTFVAPVAGTYVFSVTLMTLGDDFAHYGLFRNLDIITSMEVLGNQVPYETVSNTAILRLNKGDDVSVKHTESDHGLCGSDYTMFSGFLLSQDLSGASPAIVGK